MLMVNRVWLKVGIAVLTVTIPLTGCGGDRTAPASPAATPAGLLGNNPDGSTLKVTTPVHQSPTNFFELDDLRPVFHFTAAQGRHVQVTLGHEVEVQTETGQHVRSVPVVAGATQVTYPGDLDMATTYRWRVRAAYQGHVGPWSGFAMFVTRSIPLVTPETLEAYLFEFAAGPGNAEWSGCAGGSGTACFRFVWDLVESMNPTCDPNSWGLLSKNPGEWQCTRSQCGSLGGDGFGEDIVTHGGFSPILLWDVIVGAGAPGAALGASPIPRDARRPGNEWVCPWR
jgi:hypothetical protein